MTLGEAGRGIVEGIRYEGSVGLLDRGVDKSLDHCYERKTASV